MRGLIIAAGQGSRLAALTPDTPKSMLRIGSRTLIQHILAQLRRAGIDEVIIVTGFKEEKLRHHLGHDEGLELNIRFQFNPDWKKKNGLSVLSGKEVLSNDTEFVLVMSDHLFNHKIAEKLLKSQLGKNQILLAVDRRIDSVFDIDDATKVMVSDRRILGIGKTLSPYNGIDCGVFRCTPYIFEALERAKKNGDCSLTDAGEILADEGLLLAEDCGRLGWIDVDTPPSLEYAERNLSTILG